MPVPVVDIEQMRRWEQATWATGKREWEVILQVGRQLARRIRSLTRPGDKILILCGRGHNGDDARATVEHLSDRSVRIIQVHDPAQDIQQIDLARQWQPHWIVDGLFGIGLNRPLDSSWQQFIRAVNELHSRVLAVDVPSGLNAQSGEVMGEAIRAELTVTLAAPKIGLIAPDAWRYTGRIEVEPDIGLIDYPIQSSLLWTLSDDFDGFPPARELPAHKGQFGHLVIVAGSTGYHGAAVLAARAAQRAQPGLISLWTMAECYAAVAAQLQAVMVHPCGNEPLRWPAKTTAFLFGPGLAAVPPEHPIRREFVRLWREAPVPVIVDASSLDWLEPGPVSTQAPRIITPHPGEAARLLQSDTASIQRDRIAALRRLSERFGRCWVVLKGYHTLIGKETGPVYLNPTGNPFLAQGGAGDVLAGFLAGWLAQPMIQKHEMERAIRFAVFEHGAAADRLHASRRVWTPEELVSELRGFIC